MKKVKISTVIALIILTVFTTVPATVSVYVSYLNGRQGEIQVIENKFSKLQEVMNVIDERYIGEYSEEEAMEVAVAGYVQGVGDRWSYYMTAEEYAEYKADSEKSLVGIGVTVVYSSEKDAMLVTHVYDNSPASQAGIQKLDYIVAVEGQYVSDIGYTEAVTLVSGEEATEVAITVLKDEEEETVAVSRANFDKTAVFYEMIDGQIGYIQITEFSSNVFHEFENAVKALREKGAAGFIFDVRNNPGGYLTELVDTLDYVLPEGDIIITEGVDGYETVYTSDEACIEEPFAVLINESSISAGEFFPAAIQEYGAGVVIGTKTGGKGYTQQIVELSDGSVINLSINKYYTPNRNSLADTGVTPDITVELTEEEQENFYFLDFQTDPQISRAVEEVYKELLG